jgi:acyl-CoA thioesterase-2
VSALLELLDLDELGARLFRGAPSIRADHPVVYGGQVAAQALRAAGRTVPDDRTPHSLHGYFLRPGHAAEPIRYEVFLDRDGRSYSARRVVALQDGEVIFSMAASFHRRQAGPEVDHPTPGLPGLSGLPGLPGRPDGPGPPDSPDELPVADLYPLPGIDMRQPEQPYGAPVWPTRFWARCTEAVGDDPLLHACVLTYVSDVSTGLTALPLAAESFGASIDHAVWFHRPARTDHWLLLDHVPRTVSGGRGWYTGSVTDPSGALMASLTQEAVVRTPRR